MSKYFGGFADAASIASNFEIKQDEKPPTEEEVRFAAYEGSSYEGAAIVVYERDGKLYCAEGSHCSCNGLEDQWSPTETNKAALAMMKLSTSEHEQDTIAAFTKFVETL